MSAVVGEKETDSERGRKKNLEESLIFSFSPLHCRKPFMKQRWGIFGVAALGFYRHFTTFLLPVSSILVF